MKQDKEHIIENFYMYCKHFIFSVYDIWQNLNFWLFSMDLNWHFILMNFINAHIAMYLIWQMDTTPKGSKKNTSPNVIHLQYHYIIKQFCSHTQGRSGDVPRPQERTREVDSSPAGEVWIPCTMNRLWLQLMMASAFTGNSGMQGIVPSSL